MTLRLVVYHQGKYCLSHDDIIKNSSSKIFPKPFQINNQKVEKTGFLTVKWSKATISKGQNVYR